MGVAARVRRADLFGALPAELRQSSYLGLCFSALFLALAGYLLLHQLAAFRRSRISSELLVDHRKDDRDVRVSLDVTLFRYPCALLSLDKADAVHSHALDVREGLAKQRLARDGAPLGEFAPAAGADFAQRLAAAEAQLRAEEGCRVVGEFSVKLVPGNFHLSFHAHVAEFRAVLARGLAPDFSHRVDRLRFGEAEAAARLQRDFRLETLDSLRDTRATDLARLGFPHSVDHHINIVPTRLVYEHSGESVELFQYTSTMMRSAGGGQIVFHLGVENVLMVFKLRRQSLAHLLAMLMAIFGGLYMLLRLVAALVEDSLLGTVFKRRLGKLD